MLFSEVLKNRHRQIEAIFTSVAEHFNIDWRELYSKRKTHKTSARRQIVWLIMLETISPNHYTVAQLMNITADVSENYNDAKEQIKLYDGFNACRRKAKAKLAELKIK